MLHTQGKAPHFLMSHFHKIYGTVSEIRRWKIMIENKLPNQLEMVPELKKSGEK